MPPPNKKAKHLGGARANALICKQNWTTSKSIKEKRSYAWAAISDIHKEKSDILMNTKGWVWTLEENKLVLLVIYREL